MTTDNATTPLATDPATATDLDQIARRAFAALARHDLSRPDLIWARDAVDHLLPVGDAVGRDAIVAFFAEMVVALPDFSVEVEHTVTHAPFVVVQWRATGTFTGGKFQGIRANGREICFRGCDVMQILDGLIVDNTAYWDNAGFARQVGLLPPLGSRADRALLRSFNAVTRMRALFGGAGQQQHRP